MSVLKESPEKDEAGQKATPEKEKETPKGSADRKVSPMDDVDDDVPQAPAEGNLDRNLGKGISLLKEEAKSLGHLMSHHPKNPYCDVCNKAKMTKPPSYRRDGSSIVEAKKFGDHITCDFLITGDEYEMGIDEEKCALIVKDIYSNFMYVYPSARKSAELVILAMKHCYSDNAPELINAMKELKWRHVLSKAYISASNAVGERSIRTVLEGTRVNLLQSGLNHGFWPYAARHWCVMNNNLYALDGTASPWELRFGEQSPIKCWPFGRMINYWNGPKKKPKDELRFDPTSSAGVFIGYIVHPGFQWRTAYFVVDLKSAKADKYEDMRQIKRVIRIDVPEPFTFPLKDRKEMVRRGEIADAAEEEVETVLEVQDAVESAAPNPKAETLAHEKSDTILPKGPIVRGSGARAVWNQGWLAFIGSGISDGWCDYAECKVKYSPCEGKFLDPRADVNTEPYSYRTTLMHSDEESWHVVESNALIHPWDRSMDGLLEVVGATIIEE